MNIQKFKAIYITILVTITIGVCGFSMWRFGNRLVNNLPVIRFNKGISFVNNINSVSEHHDLDAFDSIKIDVDVADFKVVYGTGYAVDFTYPEKMMPVASVNGGELFIESPQSGSLTFGNNPACKIIITVPSGTKFDKVDIDVDAGNVIFSNINAKNFNVNADAGNVEIDDCISDNLTISADAGSVDIRGSKIKFMDVKTNLGSVDVKNCELDDVVVTTDMGSTTIKSDFKTGNFTSSMGSIDVRGQFDSIEAKCSMGSVDVKNSNEDAKYDIKTDLGNIEINGVDYYKSYKN